MSLRGWRMRGSPPALEVEDRFRAFMARWRIVTAGGLTPFDLASIGRMVAPDAGNPYQLLWCPPLGLSDSLRRLRVSLRESHHGPDMPEPDRARLVARALQGYRIF